MTFNINGVEKGTYGEAVLRIGVGRDFGKSLMPTVKVNGTLVSVPSNYRGDDQKDKTSFFGMLEIPISNELLKQNNEVVITFADNGGYISSVTLRSYVFSNDIRNSTPTNTTTNNHFDPTIKIYPNPVTNRVTISMGNEMQSAYNVNIYSLTGEKVFSATNTIGEKSFDLKNLKSGFYYVELFNESYFKTSTFIKN